MHSHEQLWSGNTFYDSITPESQLTLAYLSFKAPTYDVIDAVED